MGLFFTGTIEEVVYKLMCTLCQIKIANSSGEKWGIESEHDLRVKLKIFSKKFYEQKKRIDVIKKRIKDAEWLSDITDKELLTPAPDHQFHQSIQAQVLYQLKNNYRNPSFFELDSS